jgi:hypothetical protein
MGARRDSAAVFSLSFSWHPFPFPPPARSAGTRHSALQWRAEGAPFIRILASYSAPHFLPISTVVHTAFQRVFTISSRCQDTYLAQSPHCSTCAINMNDNNLREHSLLRRDSARSTLRTPRRNRFAIELSRDQRRSRSDVHLLPCSPPTGSLESAPRTSLRDDSAYVRWEGFWCVADEGYYARGVRADGTEQWYRIADEDLRAHVEPRVLTLRPRNARHAHTRMLLVRPSEGRLPILIGTSRRGSRARPRGSAGGRA